ncbi:hypothetical protein SDC9_195663 [bioreactor metagenome]|uniref:Uncharacterized protein n=1 Tax=bioreactor metagenome TaxID=1076179 RepID=A0A645IC73_9ZZZZ
MHFTYFTASRFQVSLIRCIKQGYIVIQHIDVFLLKHLTVLAKHFIAILIILAIFCYLVNEE